MKNSVILSVNENILVNTVKTNTKQRKLSGIKIDSKLNLWIRTKSQCQMRWFHQSAKLSESWWKKGDYGCFLFLSVCLMSSYMDVL